MPAPLSSPPPPPPLPAQVPVPVPPPPPSPAHLYGPPLAAVAAAGAGGAWAVSTATPADRAAMAAIAALAALLLGAVVALADARSRIRREARVRADAVRAEAARNLAGQVRAAQHAALRLEQERRKSAEAEGRWRAAAQAEAVLRGALEAETAKVAALEREASRLAEVILPRAVEQLRSGKSAPTVLARLEKSPGRAHQRLLEAMVGEIGASERMRAAVMAACANAASRVQALSTSMLADLREMEMRHSEEVLGDLLTLDHDTAQAGRMADSIAVLTGSRSGRRWTKPIVMESILRGALGRISAYRRVRLHSASTVAVAGYAAEGVMHALAEIMDNATTFSPPTEEVHVYVQETHSGVVVTVEDGGLVMPPSTLLQAEKLVSARPLDLRDLSGTRLGLAVVGSLARKYGLTVSFRPSSRGGTGVVVLIPAKLITQPREEWPRIPEPARPRTPEPAAWAPGREAPRAHVRPAAEPVPAPRAAAAAAPPLEAARPYEGGGARPYEAAGPQDGGSTRPYEGGRPFEAARPYEGGRPFEAARPYEATGSYERPGPYEAAEPYEGAKAPAPLLPRRTRGRTLADSGHLELAAPPPSEAARERAARARATSGERFGAFRQAARGQTPARPANPARLVGAADPSNPANPADTAAPADPGPHAADPATGRANPARPVDTAAPANPADPATGPALPPAYGPAPGQTPAPTQAPAPAPAPDPTPAPTASGPAAAPHTPAPYSAEPENPAPHTGPRTGPHTGQDRTPSDDDN